MTSRPVTASAGTGVDLTGHGKERADLPAGPAEERDPVQVHLDLGVVGAAELVGEIHLKPRLQPAIAGPHVRTQPAAGQRPAEAGVEPEDVGRETVVRHVPVKAFAGRVVQRLTIAGHRGVDRAERGMRPDSGGHPRRQDHAPGQGQTDQVGLDPVHPDRGIHEASNARPSGRETPMRGRAIPASRSVFSVCFPAGRSSAWRSPDPPTARWRPRSRR